MSNNNMNSKKGELAGHDRGVSEIVGNVLLFGIIVIAIGLLTLTGTHVIDNARSSATLNSVEQAFTMADSRLSKARFSTAIYQESPFEISGGLVTVNGSWDDSHIIIMDINNSADNPIPTIIYNGPLGTIKCDTGNGIVAYQDGGVWMLGSSGGSIMLSPPDFDYNGVTLTLPITCINGNSSMATSGNIKSIINVNSTGASSKFPGEKGINPLPQGHYIKISIKSDYYQAWADYLNDRTNVIPEIDALNKLVNIYFNTGSGKYSGYANSSWNTKSMDTTFIDPVKTFILDLYPLNPGAEYTVTYGVEHTGNTNPVPDFQITIDCAQKKPNQFNYTIKTLFTNDSGTEIFSGDDPYLRKNSDGEIYVDLLNSSINLTYDGSYDSNKELLPSFTWGDNVNDGDSKSLYDIIQHYLLYMAVYDQENGNILGGPKYTIDKKSDFKFNEDPEKGPISMLYLEFKARQKIKYLYVTEGTLNTNLASSG